LLICTAPLPPPIGDHVARLITGLRSFALSSILDTHVSLYPMPANFAASDVDTGARPPRTGPLSVRLEICITEIDGRLWGMRRFQKAVGKMQRQ
jgi:hypothetical protein